MRGTSTTQFQKLLLGSQNYIYLIFFWVHWWPLLDTNQTVSPKEKVHSDFIYKYKSRTINNRTDNTILKYLKIWYKVHKTLGMNVGLSPNTSLRQNEFIPTTLNNKILDIWHYIGIQRLEHCFSKGLLMVFEHLKRTYGLPNQTLFCYCQLRWFLRAKLGPEWLCPSWIILTDCFIGGCL